ncbi:hypothetical protein GQ53DRAFT_140090 [Thozetella sp. PMI_491]|nr:hypothetical protein GQ53DRAFT_140090 [Thozetella sp. PMI_491]
MRQNIIPLLHSPKKQALQTFIHPLLLPAYCVFPTPSISATEALPPPERKSNIVCCLCLRFWETQVATVPRCGVYFRESASDPAWKASSHERL